MCLSFTDSGKVENSEQMTNRVQGDECCWALRKRVIHSHFQITELQTQEMFNKTCILRRFTP